ASGFLDQTIKGIHDVYLVLTGTMTSSHYYIGNFDKASFSMASKEPDAEVTVEFENYDSWSTEDNTFNHNPMKTENNNGGMTVSNTFDGAWLTFDQVDFGTQGVNHLKVIYDAPSEKAPSDVKVTIRLNDEKGT